MEVTAPPAVRCPAQGCTHVEGRKPGDATLHPYTAIGERLSTHMLACPHVDAEIRRATQEDT